MAVNVMMPQLGESVVEGTITKWLVKEGDSVTKDQPIVTIATDKADSEVPAPAAGVIARFLAQEGQTVPVNTPIAVLEPGAAKSAAAPAPASTPSPSHAPSADDAAAHRAVGSTPSTLITADRLDPTPRDPRAAGPTAPLSPAVRKAAREYGIDVSTVAGSGEHNRVTKQDVLAEVARRAGPPSAPAPSHGAPSSPHPPSSVPPPQTHVAPPAPRVSSAPAAAPHAPSSGAVPFTTGAFRPPPYVAQPGDEVVPFSRRRRIIADHMVYSKHVAPHVMTLAEIDLWKTHRLREQHKGALKAEGINLTFLAFVAAATVRALRENPLLNSRVLDDAYVKLKRIHLGIAVETAQGLVVPVVRDADNYTVRGLARAIEQVATKARDGNITADDLAGATFTISNPGAKGNLVGAAIISQPNVGILRIGEIVKRPVVVEVDGVDTIAIHPVMFAALSYDHRIVDGVAANNFLYRITELIEGGTFEI